MAGEGERLAARWAKVWVAFLRSRRKLWFLTSAIEPTLTCLQRSEREVLGGGGRVVVGRRRAA